MFGRPLFLPLMILGLLGCGAPQDEQDIPPKADTLFDTVADAKACASIKAALVESGRFQTSQIADCDGIIDSSNPRGFRIMRVNGYCREEICGSVLMGWYAVEVSSSRVYVIDDVADWTLGKEVTPPR